MGEARTDVVSRKLSTIVAAILAVDLSLGSVGSSLGDDDRKERLATGTED